MSDLKTEDHHKIWRYFSRGRWIVGLIGLVAFSMLMACTTSPNAVIQAKPRASSTTATPTLPPPPPEMEYSPVSDDSNSPVVIQRFPRRGESLSPAESIELVFNQPMDQSATADAFTLQPAKEQNEPVAGDIRWPNEQTLQFTPAESLERGTLYDVVLTQAATTPEDAPLSEPFTFRFSTSGFLEVTQVIPSDGTNNIETDSTITVMFNRPVVPLTSLEEAEDFPMPLEFDPPLSGEGEWLNTSIYVFTPEEDIPGGVTVQATVKAGLTDAAEQVTLVEDFTWSFTTQPPEIVFTKPNDGQTLVPIDTAIQITFNQPVDAQSAQEHFNLVADGFLDSEVSGDFLIEGNQLVFTPTQALDFDTSYQVTVESGVTSTAGGKGMLAPYTVQFTSVPLPRIVGTEPSDGTNDARPRTDFRILFNTAINPDTVMEHIKMDPPLPITPTLVYTYYSPWNNAFGLSFGAKPSTDYEVQISPGIEDPYGNETQENLNVQFRTAPLPPHYQLRTPDLVGTYDADLPAKLFVSFVNVTRINFRLYQLDPAEIARRPLWEWNEFNSSPNNLIRDWTERLEAPANENSFHVVDLVEEGGTLSPGLYFLESNSPDMKERNYEPRHILVVSETNLTLKSGEEEALVWATDLATGEPIADLELDFYNQEGNTLGSETTDEEGIARLTLDRRLDRAPILAVVLPQGDSQSFAAVSDNWSHGINPYDFGLEMAYNLAEYNLHLYTDRPIYRPGQTVNFKGVLRTEDDVTFGRPDLQQIHVTIRDAAYEIIFDEMVDLTPAGTFNSQIDLEEGAVLGNYIITTDFANQYFEQSFQVAAYRPPEFEITIEPNATELLRSEDIEATIQANYFFGGALPNAEVTWNLLAETYRFDAPQLGSYTFNDADDPYVCFDCWWWWTEPTPENLLSGEGTTDAQGQLTVNVSGEELDELLASGSHRVIIEATVVGPDNQFISGRNELIVHKGDYYLGLRAQEYVADAGEETAIDLVAVDWQANRLADKTVAVQIVRYEWVNSFIENEQGGGYWDYRTEKELVEELTVTTDEQGEAVIQFTPPQGGSYQIIAQDDATLISPSEDEEDSLPRSNIRTSFFIWVAGEDDISWRRENHDRINLISDKFEYAPGETAEILIPSPFTGEHQALITIERGKIIEHEVITIESNSQVYQLPITEDYAPNIYVSVVLIQGREGPQTGDAPRLANYKVGILPLDVTPTAQKLNISLTSVAEQTQPGEEVTYNLEVTDHDGNPVEAEFSLDVVDKSILTLRPRQSEAIVETFYHRRGLGINTSSSLSISVNRLIQELAQDLGLDENEFSATDQATDGVVAQAVPSSAPVAEGGELEMAAEEAEADMVAKSGVSNRAGVPEGVEVREEFSDTAYWNPVVLTDEQGHAEVTLTLPDNLTTWVMRGVGVTDETLVGEEISELVSTKPLLIRPVSPRFFVVDDKAQLAANVNNNTDEALEVEVTLATDDGLIIAEENAAVQTVTVPAREELKVTWNVTVQDVSETEIVFAAVSTDGEYEDAAKPRLTTGPDGTLMVLRYTAPDIVGTAGQLVEAGDRTEVIALPPNFDERRGDLSIQIDPSLAAGMQEGLSYLEHYEYECTEQTVSRFLPNLLTYDALQSLGIENEELAKRLPGLVETGLEKLYVQQKSDGGWGWWAEDESNLYITSYVVFALTKAQQTSDVQVSDTVLSNGQNFLLNHLVSTRQLNSTHEANKQAFILYALAEGGRAPQDNLESLFEDREKLSHYARAYLALSLHLTDAQGYEGNIQTLLSDLNNAAILSATGAHWEEQTRDWWAMNTDTRSTAIILDALTRLDPENELIPNVVRWLMVARQDGIWETTQETAWALIALTDWMVETGELEADYEYQVTLNEEELQSGSVTPESVQDSVQLQVAVADLAAEASNLLTIARSDGNGRLYYSAHLKVYLPVEEIEPVDRGIIVQRRYTLESCADERCNEVREARLGDVIRVDLTIIAPNDLYYVLVEDPLPAGAEAVDTGLATTSLLAMDPTLSRTVENQNRSPYWYWWRWYSRSELRDEKVVLFADYLPKGSYEYSYTMRTTLPGDYHVLPTLATEFYFPEVFGRSEGRILSIGQ